MASNILVCVDREGRALAAGQLAAGLAERFGGKLRALHVLEQTRRPWAHAEVLHDAVLAEVCEVETAAVRSVLPHTTTYRWRQGHPVREILAEIAEAPTDLVVLGRHHEGMLDSLVGGTAINVLRRVDIPVLVHKNDRTELPRSLLVCVDLSELSELALGTAIEWARVLEIPVHVLFVFEPPAFCYGGHASMPSYTVDAIMKAEREGLDAMVARVDWQGVEHDVQFEVGTPGPTVVHVAQSRQSDLIVVGSHGRTGFDRILLGSVSEYVIRHGDRSVLVVRRPED